MKISLAPLLFASLGGLVAAACSESIDYSAKTAPVGACGDVETHIVGIYDSGGQVVEIKLDRPGKHNVVVSAHESVRWKISTSNGARLMKVYAVGYHEQKVAVPTGTTVLKDSFDTTGVYACGFTDGEARGCDSDQLQNLASKMIHHVSSFHGCGSATKWTIGNDLGTTSNCVETSQYDTIEGCIAYMNGDNTCGDTEPPGGGTTDPNGGDGGPDGTGGDQSGGGGGTGEPGPVFLSTFSRRAK